MMNNVAEYLYLCMLISEIMHRSIYESAVNFRRSELMNSSLITTTSQTAYLNICELRFSGIHDEVSWCDESVHQRHEFRKLWREPLTDLYATRAQLKVVAFNDVSTNPLMFFNIARQVREQSWARNMFKFIIDLQ
jgi:hypothetical protein